MICLACTTETAGLVRNGVTLRNFNSVLFLLGLLTAGTQNNIFIKLI